MRKEYQKLLTNTGLFAIGSFASSLLSMFLVPLYTAVLSTEDYGISDLIATTTSLLYPFTTIAISEAIMRFALDKGTDRRSVYTIGIGVAIIGFALVLCGTPFLMRSTIGSYTGFFLLYYIFYCLHTVTSYFVKGLEKIQIYSLAGLINSAIVIFCNLLFLLAFRWGIKGYLISSILGHGITMLFMFYSGKLYQYFTVPWKIDFTLFKNMIMYSLPIIPNSISWWIANSSDKYILNYFADVSQVGIYSVAYKIPSIVMTVMGLFISAWQLSAVEDFGSEKSKRFFADVYGKCFMCNILVAAGLVLFAKPFGAFLYSADFFEAWRYVPVLVIANVYNVMASFMGTIYTSAKKTKMLAISTMVGAGANILMNIVLIPQLGAMGAALATALSYLLMWIVRLISTRKILKFPMDWKRNGIVLALLVVEAALICIDTLLTHIFAAAIFAALLLCYKGVVVELIREVFKIIGNKFKKNGNHPAE